MFRLLLLLFVVLPPNADAVTEVYDDSDHDLTLPIKSTNPDGMEYDSHYHSDAITVPYAVILTDAPSITGPYNLVAIARDSSNNAISFEGIKCKIRDVDGDAVADHMELSVHMDPERWPTTWPATIECQLSTGSDMAVIKVPVVDRLPGDHYWSFTAISLTVGIDHDVHEKASPNTYLHRIPDGAWTEQTTWMKDSAGNDTADVKCIVKDHTAGGGYDFLRLDLITDDTECLSGCYCRIQDGATWHDVPVVIDSVN